MRLGLYKCNNNLIMKKIVLFFLLFTFVGFSMNGQDLTIKKIKKFVEKSIKASEDSLQQISILERDFRRKDIYFAKIKIKTKTNVLNFLIAINSNDYSENNYNNALIIEFENESFLSNYVREYYFKKKNNLIDKSRN